MQGSNAAGGVLHLQNELSILPNGLRFIPQREALGFGIECFNAWRSGAAGHRLQWGRNQADNDFVYLNARGERHKRSDADFHQDMANTASAEKLVKVG